MMEATERAFENDNKKVKKTKFKKLTINDLLSRTCWNPENFDEYSEWQNKQANNPIENISNYPGVRLYDVQLHCTQFIIRARMHENGGYQIFDFLEKDH